jgi:MoaA/NifB/PqqE/SkfB family radical SAM enzyme
MMYLSVFKGFGFELLLEVEGRSARMRARGLLAPLIHSICEGFNKHASLEKVADVRENDVVISSLIPPAPSGPFERLIKAQIKRRLWHKHTPESLMLLLTNRCQCTCLHCITYGIRGKPELSTDEICNVIDQALELGAYNVSFEGGEPTLRKDLFALIEHVDESKAITHVITNGLLLDRKYVRRLKEAGLDYLHISLDSPYAEIHNKFRGVPKLFEKVTAGMKYGVEMGLLTVIEYTATPENSDIKTLNDLYNYGKALGVHEILIDEVVPGGRWAFHEEDVLTDEDRMRLIEIQNEANREMGPRVCCSFHLRNPSIVGCFAGRRWLWISPTGEVMPCLHIPISFGNVRDESLKGIWRKMRKHPLFKKKPDVCAWMDPYFKEHYFDQIRSMVNSQMLPCSIADLDKG